VAEVSLGRATFRPRVAVALALAISGSAIVAVGGGDLAITTTGVLCIAGSIVLFSTYVLVSDRLLVRTDSLTAATWSALGAAAGVTFVGAVRGELEAPDADAFAALLANGVATAVAFTLWFVVLGRIGATRTAIVMAMEAVVGIVLSAIFLDESVKAIVAVGGVAVLAGAVLAALAQPASELDEDLRAP
jgi:drug/metabolite transporter (DMT)-like permease